MVDTFSGKSDKYIYLALAKSLQSCLTLCDPMDGSPPGSCPWILRARILDALLQGIFLTQGSNLSLTFPALAGWFFTISTTWEAPYIYIYIYVCTYIHKHIYTSTHTSLKTHIHIYVTHITVYMVG